MKLKCPQKNPQKQGKILEGRGRIFLAGQNIYTPDIISFCQRRKHILRREKRAYGAKRRNVGTDAKLLKILIILLRLDLPAAWEDAS